MREHGDTSEMLPAQSRQLGKPGACRGKTGESPSVKLRGIC